MPYCPSNRRVNHVRLRCQEMIRTLFPAAYREVIREAEAKFPRKKAGRPRGKQDAIRG